MKRILPVIFCIILLNAAHYDILFLGNSYTFYNSLPVMVAAMGTALGDDIYQQSSTPGGYTLWQHTTNSATVTYLSDTVWDYVLLQDQSQMPVIPYYRDSWTFPGGEILSGMCREICAEPVFFMTWGSDIGGAQCIESYCSADFADYYGYQDSLAASYTRLADTNDASCAPVGLVWRRVYELRPDFPFWSGDGRHPGIYGSYIAACAIYSTVTGNPVSGSEYIATLPEDDALFIQTISDSIVFLEDATWHRNSTRVIADFFYMNDGPTFFFEDSSINADTWIWDFGDGDFSTLRNAVHEYRIDGTYTVTQTAIGTCGSDTISQEITVIGAMVADSREKGEATLYSEVSDSEIRLFSSEDIISVRLTDISGRTVATSQPITVDRMPAGVYILTAETRYSRLNQRVVLGVR